VDFLLRAKRDVAAAKAFFRRAFAKHGRLPQKITLDGYQASHRAARELLARRQGGRRGARCLIPTNPTSHDRFHNLHQSPRCRVRTENAPANFTTLKHIANNLIRKAPGKDSQRVKRMTAAWDDDFLASLVAA
jgi:transposase-like protein